MGKHAHGSGLSVMMGLKSSMKSLNMETLKTLHNFGSGGAIHGIIACTFNWSCEWTCRGNIKKMTTFIYILMEGIPCNSEVTASAGAIGHEK